MNSTFSIVRATVTNNQDPEKLGRVKVKYPFLGSKAKNNESDWCRVVRPVAHAGAGDWALPDVNDEVLIAFENGDLGRPIVIGSLYSEAIPPFKTGLAGDHNADGKNTLRGLKTRSGHTLIFDDSEGKETVLLKDSNGHVLKMDKKGVSLKTAAGDEIQIEDQKSITLKTSKGHSLKMTEENVKLESKDGEMIELKSGGITIKSSGKVSIQGSSKIELGDGASKSLLFGEDVMQAFNTHTHSTSYGPTSPPVAPMTPGVLSKKVKTS
jgi:uncharacterized protein involved in type VI secretion and phage assembly